MINQVESLPSRRQGIFYGWWLVGLASITMALTNVPLFQGMAVWAVALQRQFGWSPTKLGLAFAFTRFEGGIMGPVEGYLTDRLGTQRMVFIGLLIMSAGFLYFGHIRNLWMFYSAFILISLGHSLGGFLPLMTMLNHWFVRNRAQAMGWASAGNRLGSLIMVPAIAWAINPDRDRVGWEHSAFILSGFMLLVAVVLPRLIRNRPGDYNLLPDGDPPDSSPTATTQSTTPRSQRDSIAQGAPELTASQALRTSAFWLISIGHGFTAMVVLAITVHLGLLMQDKGFDIQTTGWIIGIYAAVSMVSTIFGGYVGDRMPKNVVIFFFTSVLASSVIILTFSDSLSMMYVFAILFGIGWGGRAPLTMAIRGDYFGRSSYAKILGLSLVPMNALLLISSPFAGLMRDIYGTYTYAFLPMAILSFLGGMLFLIAKKPVVKPPSDLESTQRAI